MAQNVSYANNDTILETLVLHTLPDFGEHGNGIINNNFLLSYLKEKNRLKVLDGGLEFWKGLRATNNTNAKWQGLNEDMAANIQSPDVRLHFDIKVFTCSIVLNELHKAMNKGRAMMKNLAQEFREQAEDTIPNQFNSAFWATSPGTNEPESIPSLITTDPMVGTIGGLTRSTHSALQNGAFITGVSDIGSETGLAALKLQQVQRAIGSGGKDMANLIIMPENLWAGLCSFLQTQRRYSEDTKMAALDFDTIKLGNTTIGYENTQVANSENSITPGYVYGINSNHLNFEVLKDGNFRWADQFERVGQKLSKALYFWVFGNLTTNLPKSHFVMTNVSTT